MSNPSYLKLAGILIACWFAFSLFASSQGVFQATPGGKPLPVLLAVVLPVALFFIALRVSAGLRQFAMNLDIRTLTVLQSWRTVGFGFLALYTYGILPGSFAFPAGLGDIAVGLTAPFVALSLTRYRHRALFLWWQVFGIVDLVTAVSLGATGRFSHPEANPLANLPLSLIPTFAVPLLLIIHIISISQALHWSAADRPKAAVVSSAA